ncbi:MAG: hypothetical protein VKP62_12550 [Candidatus Sericytochromatia bacterium]|nr:hypothetical protein [Candidatus Sericytochromatia bacterium]
MASSRFHASILSLMLLSGCTGAGSNVALPRGPAERVGSKASGPAHASTAGQMVAAPSLLPPVPAGTREFRALTNPADLVGTVTLNELQDDYFASNAVAYRLAQAVGPVRSALVTVSSLDERLYTRNGQVVQDTTATGGAFTLTASIPATAPCVVNALLARGHRLSAIVPAGASHTVLDESTSMVAELARWQLYPDATATGPSLADLTAPDLDTLLARTRTLAPQVPLEDTGASLPLIEALRAGSGHILRNAYVEAFGSRVTAGGASTPVVANELSEQWFGLLGFRPLALTRLAGIGIRGYAQSDGMPALTAQIVEPVDAVRDDAGHLFFTQDGVQLVSMVPAAGANLSGPLYGANEPSLTGDNLYTIAGVVNGPPNPNVWESAFRGAADATLGDGVPMQPDGFPLYNPAKLAVEEATGTVTRSSLYFTQPLTGRVMLLPGGDIRHFHRDSLASPAFEHTNLYSVAGRGIPLDPIEGASWGPPANGQTAQSAWLAKPTGLQRDAAGNLWILDAGLEDFPGAVLVVREQDGLIFRVPLTLEGAPYTPDGALDLRLSPPSAAQPELYVADTRRHWVFKFTRQDPATFSVGTPPATQAITRVVGKRDVPGFIDTQLPGVNYPSVYETTRGIPDPDGNVAPTAVTALLNLPGSICFTADGHLLVGDTGNGRVRLKQNGKVYTLAGGFDTRYLTGDARLAYLPSLGYINLDPHGGVLLTDRREAVVRNLHIQRGPLVSP